MLRTHTKRRVERSVAALAGTVARGGCGDYDEVSATGGKREVRDGPVTPAVRDSASERKPAVLVVGPGNRGGAGSAGVSGAVEIDGSSSHGGGRAAGFGNGHERRLG